MRHMISCITAHAVVGQRSGCLYGRSMRVSVMGIRDMSMRMNLLFMPV